MTEKKAFGTLREALLAYDEEAVQTEAQGFLARNPGPDEVLEALDVMSTAIREVGDKFNDGQIFLPELMLAAEAMKAGMDTLTPALPRGATTQHGTVVVGTAKGDIHDIGKSIVATVLTASGFNVIDLGIDVPPSAFADAAQKNAADVVAVSAIMASTVSGQKAVVDYFEALGIRDTYKLIVGGAACSREFAEHIGADGYGEDAADAVKVATQLIEFPGRQQ